MQAVEPSHTAFCFQIVGRQVLATHNVAPCWRCGTLLWLCCSLPSADTVHQHLVSLNTLSPLTPPPPPLDIENKSCVFQSLFDKKPILKYTKLVLVTLGFQMTHSKPLHHQACLQSHSPPDKDSGA